MIRKSTVIRAAAPRWAQAALCVLGAAFALAIGIGPAAAQTVRIKDIADFEGVRDNMLVGYGLAVGLNGTGDTLNRSVFTLESLTGMLERLGVNSRLPAQTGQIGTANAINNNLRTRNLAAVMVTATLPPFARQGDRIDVNVSTMGDATSLLGATLLVTPLLGADGEVYAVAQGNVAIGGFAAVGQAQSVTRGVPTNSRIANGAIVEREVGFELGAMETVRLSLKNPDLTTARRIAQAVNAFLAQPAARSSDPKTVVVNVPTQYRGDAVAMMTDIERLPVEPDQVARVIVDEHAGVIVMGENVRISTVAVAQANLTIRVTETPQVSQPAPFAPGASGRASTPTAGRWSMPAATRCSTSCRRWFRAAARAASRARSPAVPRPWWCRARKSKWTINPAAASPSCPRASRWASWSTASTRSASAPAT